MGKTSRGAVGGTRKPDRELLRSPTNLWARDLRPGPWKLKTRVRIITQSNILSSSSSSLLLRALRGRVVILSSPKSRRVVFVVYGFIIITTVIIIGVAAPPYDRSGVFGFIFSLFVYRTRVLVRRRSSAIPTPTGVVMTSESARRLGGGRRAVVFVRTLHYVARLAGVAIGQRQQGGRGRYGRRGRRREKCVKSFGLFFFFFIYAA